MSTPAIQPWSRRRLQVTAGVVAMVAVMLIAGLGLWMYGAFSGGYGASHDAPERQGATAVPTRAQGSAARDRIAAAPMLTVDPVDAREGRPAVSGNRPMPIPGSTRTGPAGVATGFPKTPQGAVGQLAAIGTSVMEQMSIPHAKEVHREWAMPGAPSAQTWAMTQNVSVFLESAELTSQAQNMGVTMTVRPAGAQIKGRDGTDWVLACVLFDVTATVDQEAKTGWGHCERMQWNPSEKTWQIAPGEAPAQAPSTWPGSEKAAQAGWRPWVFKDGRS